MRPVRAKGLIRGAYQHYKLSRDACLQGCQRWRQQTPLMQARLGLEHFNQRTLRPAAAGQRLVKPLVTRVNQLQARSAKFTRAPDAWGESRQRPSRLVAA